MTNPESSETEYDPSLEGDGDAAGWALCFEVGLGLLALLIGYGARVWPVDDLNWPASGRDILLGLAATLPPLGLVWGLNRIGWRPMQRLLDVTEKRALPFVRDLRLYELLLLSIAAGWGEEVLFRGLIQAELQLEWGPVWAVGLTSLLFASLHSLSVGYFIMTLLMSVYLGVLYACTGSLWVPVLGHALYDFAMLIYLCRIRPVVVTDS